MSGAPSPEAIEPPHGTRRRHPLLAYVARRIVVGIGLVALVSVLVFAATNILPGDVAAASLGRQASPERKAALRAELGLDRPLIEQYTSWVRDILRGDLGDSTAARQPVWGLISGRIVNTLTLAFVTMLFLIPLALLLGVLAGVRPGGPSDSSISGITLALISVPEFVLGTLLTLIFAVAWKVLPAVSLLDPGTNPLRQPDVLVLPVATLLLAGLAYMIRMVRAGVIEVTASPYVEMARLNGLSERRVIRRYILRNSLAPTVQAFALTLQWLIGGVVIVETLFAYPGLGQELVEAVTVRDLPLIQAIAILVATLYIAINIVADVLVVLLIPKLRTAQ